MCAASATAVVFKHDAWRVARARRTHRTHRDQPAAITTHQARLRLTRALPDTRKGGFSPGSHPRRSRAPFTARMPSRTR